MTPEDILANAIIFFVYLLPSFVAVVRKTKSCWGIIFLNVFTAWTYVGWIVALTWAVKGAKKEVKK